MNVQILCSSCNTGMSGRAANNTQTNYYDSERYSKLLGTERKVFISRCHTYCCFVLTVLVFPPVLVALGLCFRFLRCFAIIQTEQFSFWAVLKEYQCMCILKLGTIKSWEML